MVNCAAAAAQSLRSFVRPVSSVRFSVMALRQSSRFLRTAFALVSVMSLFTVNSSLASQAAIGFGRGAALDAGERVRPGCAPQNVAKAGDLSRHLLSWQIASRLRFIRIAPAFWSEHFQPVGQDKAEIIHHEK